MKKMYIITGASRGIGEALCKQLMMDNHFVIGIARTKNEALIQLAEEKNVPFIFIERDLSKTKELEFLIEEIFQNIPKDLEEIVLINNAGVIEPIGRAEINSPQEIEKSIAINLTAPMILTSLFIKKLEGYQIVKKVMNISSGAGRKPYVGWSAYCSGKAGLDMFSRTVFEEQKNQPYGVKIMSIAPGVIDTSMQEKIRSTSKEVFELVDRFIDYKEKGILLTPDETAQKLIEVMNREHVWESGPIQDIRKL